MIKPRLLPLRSIRVSAIYGAAPHLQAATRHQIFLGGSTERISDSKIIGFPASG